MAWNLVRLFIFLDCIVGVAGKLITLAPDFDQRIIPHLTKKSFIFILVTATSSTLNEFSQLCFSVVQTLSHIAYDRYVLIIYSSNSWSKTITFSACCLKLLALWICPLFCNILSCLWGVPWARTPRQINVCQSQNKIKDNINLQIYMFEIGGTTNMGMDKVDQRRTQRFVI